MFPPRKRSPFATTPFYHKGARLAMPRFVQRFFHGFAQFCRNMGFSRRFRAVFGCQRPGFARPEHKIVQQKPQKNSSEHKNDQNFFSKPGICAKKSCPGGSAGHVVPEMCSKKSAAHRSGLPPMGTSPTLTRSAWGRFSHRIARGRCGWSRGSRTRGRGRSGTWSR